MKMKVDLSKFKLKSRDEHTATLTHPDGHEVKIAIKALHPMNRQNLDSLQMADGGQVTQSNPKLEESKKVPRPMQSPDPAMKPAGGVRAAKGGELEIEPVNPPEPKHHIEYEPYQAPVVEKLDKPEPKQHLQYEKMAEGGEAEADEQPQTQQPIVINNMPPSQSVSPEQQQQLGLDPQQIQQAAAQSGTVDQGGIAAQQPQQPQSQQPQQPQPGSYGAGVQESEAGIKGQSAAESEGAKAQAQIMKDQAGAVNQLMIDHKAKVNEIETERKAMMQDYLNGHIEPNRFMGKQDTMGKLMTGVGLALGGLGSGLTGGPNQALEFLNRQIDRDIESQRADLGKRQTLLSMNRDRLKDENAAVEMTRMQMQDLMAAKIGESTSKSQSALAQSRGQQLLGQLHMQTAPVVQQMAVRDMVANSTPEQLSKMDPASLIQSIVPPDKQKEVSKEIGTAQNAKKNSDQILKHFDEAMKENTIGGRIGRAGFNPPSILAMRSMMLPLIHDLEGRVNEFEQKTTSDLEPKPGDKAATVAAKRKALTEFLAQKSAAPLAKTYGIDLEKFGSTQAPGSLNQQQKKYVEWAKANTSDPRAKLVLKKLNAE